MQSEDKNNRKEDIFQALIRSGRADFPFDREGVKNRLLQSIASAPRTAPKTFGWSLGRLLAPLAVGAVSFGLILATTSAMTYASNTVPGDNMYFLNTFQEKLVLTLPLPQEQKSDMRFGFTYKHLNEVSQVQDRSKDIQIKTLKQSRDFVTETIEQAVTSEQSLRQQGKTRSAENVTKNLTSFEAVAEQHVKKLEQIREDIKTDSEIKKEIEEHLKEIKNARQKARQELRNEQKFEKQTEE